MHGDPDVTAAPVLVTGATGYIGGRLVPRLLARGVQVRCLVRDAARLAGRSWSDEVGIIEGDLADPGAVETALRGADAAYYLVHSMGHTDEFRQRDRDLAVAFGDAASRAGVGRMIYLGGLGDPERVRSAHLLSRHEVGGALGVAGVPVVELRAAIIVGSGSASFEMLRHLTERVPVMIAPRWIETRCQPIGVRSVLDYLIEVLERRSPPGVYEIGGPDVLTYREMILAYARLRGLRRAVWSLPVPHPEWSSRFLALATPIPERIARPLVESLQHDMVVRDDRARRELSVAPMGFHDALTLALARLASDEVETTWASSLASARDDDLPHRELAEHEGMFLERHQLATSAPPARVFGSICALGGDDGWPAGNWLWQLRGAVDRWTGGVGMRRGRRHPRHLLVGEPLDFWRVEALEPEHLLRLHAEMRLPGRAWLQFEVLADGDGARVEQTAFFEPHGLLGHLYWFGLLPFHRFIFPGLVRAICARAEQPDLAGDRPVSAPLVRRSDALPVLDVDRGPRGERDVGDAEVVDDAAAIAQAVEARAHDLGPTGQRRVLGHAEHQRAGVHVALAHDRFELERGPARVGRVDDVGVVHDPLEHADPPDDHGYQPSVPGSPLNGPSISDVTHPP